MHEAIIRKHLTDRNIRSLDPIGLTDGQMNGVSSEQPYNTDLPILEKELLDTYPSAEPEPLEATTIFLTGATGFLGAFILRDLLCRAQTRVVVHVRAKSEAEGLKRVRETCEAYGIWSEDWLSRLSCVSGDLQKANLGMSTEAWEKVAGEADNVIHNGAKVHWVQPCKLKPYQPVPFPQSLPSCQP